MTVPTVEFTPSALDGVGNSEEKKEISNNIMLLVALAFVMKERLALEARDAQKDPTIAQIEKAYAQAAERLPPEEQKAFWEFMDSTCDESYPPELRNYFHSQAKLFDQLDKLYSEIEDLKDKKAKAEENEAFAGSLVGGMVMLGGSKVLKGIYHREAEGAQKQIDAKRGLIKMIMTSAKGRGDLLAGKASRDIDASDAADKEFLEALKSMSHAAKIIK